MDRLYFSSCLHKNVTQKSELKFHAVVKTAEQVIEPNVNNPISLLAFMVWRKMNALKNVDDGNKKLPMVGYVFKVKAIMVKFRFKVRAGVCLRNSVILSPKRDYILWRHKRFVSNIIYF